MTVITPKSHEALVAEELGALHLRIVMLRAELEQVKAELAALTAKAAG